jgi:hypothetical protein
VNISVQEEEDRRKLHYEELRNLYPLLGIAGAINVTVMKPKPYVACIREVCMECQWSKSEGNN